MALFFKKKFTQLPTHCPVLRSQLQYVHIVGWKDARRAVLQGPAIPVIFHLDDVKDLVPLGQLELVVGFRDKGKFRDCCP